MNQNSEAKQVLVLNTMLGFGSLTTRKIPNSWNIFRENHKAGEGMRTQDI